MQDKTSLLTKVSKLTQENTYNLSNSPMMTVKSVSPTDNEVIRGDQLW